MLRIEHPTTKELMEWHAPVPDDMVELTEVLRADTLEHGDQDY